MFNTFDETLKKDPALNADGQTIQIIDEEAVQLPTRESIIQEQGEQYNSFKSEQVCKVELANNLRISK